MSASSSLQNMAPNMQRALLISGALFALAAVVYMFCIQPAQLSLQRGRSELDSLRTRQEREMREITPGHYVLATAAEAEAYKK